MIKLSKNGNYTLVWSFQNKQSWWYFGICRHGISMNFGAQLMWLEKSPRKNMPNFPWFPGNSRFTALFPGDFWWFSQLSASFWVWKKWINCALPASTMGPAPVGDLNSETFFWVASIQVWRIIIYPYLSRLDGMFLGCFFFFFSPSSWGASVKKKTYIFGMHIRNDSQKCGDASHRMMRVRPKKMLEDDFQPF